MYIVMPKYRYLRSHSKETSSEADVQHIAPGRNWHLLPGGREIYLSAKGKSY